MKLLIDVQCIQSTSSKRGIGRYALSLTRALVQEAGPHQVELLLNGGDEPARLLRARLALETFLPPRRIHVFDAPWPWTSPYDPARRAVAEAAYGAAIRSLGPDVLLVASPFEGDEENVVAIGRSVADPPTAAVLYDLIPALNPGTYLLGPGAANYWRRLEEVRRCDALLAISRYSGEQALQVMAEQCPPVTPVWGGPYPSGQFPAFEPQKDDQPTLSVPDRFVLTVGGDHPRKNLDRLVLAWAQVPATLRHGLPLVVACRLNPGTVRRLHRLARRGGLRPDELVLTGGVSERTLHGLYARAELFVFPSVEEGLGMPPLEAMAAGCPTLMARGSSLSELNEDTSAFFDGERIDDIANAMSRTLTDESLRKRLRHAAAVSAGQFTWRRSARLAWDALAALPSAARWTPPAPPPVVRLSDALAVERLAAAPAAVLLDAPLPSGETGRLGLPVAPRAALVPATAIVGSRPALSDAVRAGVIEQPALVDVAALSEAGRHDFHAAYAEALASLVPLHADLARATVDAMRRPPRWTLERPRPVWLLLTDDTGDGAEAQRWCDAAGVDLLVANVDGVALAPSADVVLVAAAHVAGLEASLSHARCRGAKVMALHQDGPTLPTPDWCEDIFLTDGDSAYQSWRVNVLTQAGVHGRTTGWPWRDAD